ncbi:snapalysin family zinc-dependent metalloprotease [Pseudonocardiaceae bacterium YIM PH 21723]|nr:snapalysin family zinc-dependent metalloprotease [Pseudonocardiaceae bacterium YIM PH 21723]
MRRFVLSLATAVALVGIGLPVSAALAAPVTTVTYDLSQAGKYAAASRQGIQIWNNGLKNVQLKEVPAGTAGAVKVRLDTVQNTAPYYSPSTKEIVLTQKQIDPIQSDGKPYRDPIRTFVHESGHSLGLGHKTGSNCVYVMLPSPSGNPRGCHDYKTPHSSEYSAVDAGALVTSLPAVQGQTIS